MKNWKEEYKEYILKNDKESAKKLLLQVIPDDKLVYKYYRGINRDYDTITKPAVWLCNAYYLNDPFDCAFLVNTYADDIDINDVYTKQSIQDMESKNLQTTVFIACFSERDDSILMWGHYANNHVGICVGYSLKELIEKYDCFPVIYEEKLTQHKNEDSILQETLTKYVDWSYEQEWRIIQRDESKRGNVGMLIDFVKPKEIILGYKNNDLILGYGRKRDLINELDEADGNKFVSYSRNVLKTNCYQCELSKETFSLQTKRIIRI